MKLDSSAHSYAAEDLEFLDTSVHISTTCVCDDHAWTQKYNDGTHSMSMCYYK